ncbi:histidine kinase [Saccharopolyspora sp. K220]|uniref:sensor histidine kinase n=1 Tax=Saccharopolyspora soli TaxID=2926618 RepID=UPI001F575C83|nr:histidine kinase [Saccharopolyspora soli]MCI2418159.1 histidine kinase [Saccharopolyspora soli]
MGRFGRDTGVPVWLERIGRMTRAHPLLVDSGFAVLLAATLGAWTVLLLFDSTGEPVVGGAPATRPPWRELVVVSVVAGHGALVWRRVRPVPSFAVVGVATGVQMLASIWWFLPSTSLFLVALYSLSGYGARSAPAVGLVTGVAGAVVVSVCGFPLAGLPVGPAGWFGHAAVRLVPFVVAAWSLGMFRRVRVAYVAALEERAMRAEAEREERARRAVADERARIAREMHDVVAHALSVVISQADGGRYVAKADQARAVESLTTIARTGRQALADIRGLLRVLRTGTRDDEQFPHPQLADLPELLDRIRAAGVPVVFEERDPPGDGEIGLSPGAEFAAFRAVQEALTNTLKHAGPSARAQVSFAWSPDCLVIAVRDDGAGGGTGDPGHGLVGMRERLSVVGGRATAGPGSDGGFLVEAWLPRRVGEVAGEHSGVPGR